MRFDAAQLHELVENGIRDHIYRTDEEYDVLLEQAEEYSLSAGGKRLRPCILLAVCDMLGGDLYHAEAFAVALEYIHTYSLIHDDLPAMDNDDMRRGKPSNHKAFGEDIAMLAGDGLLTRAFDIMNEEFVYFPDNNKVNAMSCISSCAYAMVSGQTADIKAPEIKDGRYYDFVHGSKTAALFIAAFTAGAYLAHADNGVINDMLRAGKAYGMAFQLKDDISDMDSEENYATFLGKEAAEEKSASYLSELNGILDKYENNEILKEILGI